jgi:hypothetical protein
MARAKLTDRQRELHTLGNVHAKMQHTQTEERAVQEQQHQQTRVETESALASGRRSRAARGAITDTAVSTATPSSNSGLIMTVIFMMAGLIVVYTLVTNPGPTTGWLGTLGNSLHALSSNKPLFTTTAK